MVEFGPTEVLRRSFFSRMVPETSAGWRRYAHSFDVVLAVWNDRLLPGGKGMRIVKGAAWLDALADGIPFKWGVLNCRGPDDADLIERLLDQPGLY